MNGLIIQWGRKETANNYGWHNETITGLLFSSPNYSVFFTSEEPSTTYNGVFWLWVNSRTATTCTLTVNPYNSSQRLNYFYWFAIGF